MEAAARLLGIAVLEEREPLPFAAIDRLSSTTPRPAGPVRELIDEAVRRHPPESRTAADAWLAPRLHASLRLTRAEAADRGLWNHLAMRVAPDYVFWRHRGRASRTVPSVNRARFTGLYDQQTFARLWWAAELFRDGPDYRPVVVACGNQDVLNTVLGMGMIMHRPVAQAILTLVADGVAKSGREVNALAQAANAAGSTLVYEALAPDSRQDPARYVDWADDHGFLPYDSLPEGPDDGEVPRASVDTLVELFTRLFAEAPIRGRTVDS
ncbi:DUF6339 family protein [Nonomuraea longicatena]